MTVNKGLKSLAESDPNFSNQGLENAINELKISWVAKSITLDTAIQNNTVLTTSQKSDVMGTINNIAHLNAGRFLGDLIRHTNSILDGTIVVVPGEASATFLEILQTVHSIQNMIPTLYGVTPESKTKGVNDHLGTLNNIFLETEDSSKPVITSLKDSINYLKNYNPVSTRTNYETAIDNLKNFLDSVRADSTDFQQTLDTFASAVATAATNFDTQLQNHPYSIKRTQMVADSDTIITQVYKEKANCSVLRTYISSITSYMGYTSLAENNSLRKLMSRVSQNTNWQTYFNDYVKNSGLLNPYFNLGSDSSKAEIIDKVLLQQGLPDVHDHVDLQAVAQKAIKDSRIDTKGFDLYETQTIITKCCEQLGITTSNNTIYNQSQMLLSSLNQQDRDLIAQAIDFNDDANTLS